MPYYSSSSVLGVMRGPDALYAVLMEQTEDGLVVRFSIPPVLTSREEGGTESSLAAETPGISDPETEVTIQFGDEAETMGQGASMETGELEGNTYPTPASTDFLSALDAILRECAQRGYDDPDVVFCAPYGEVDTLELHIPKATLNEDAGSSASYLPLPRPTLLDLFERQYDGLVEPERVGFLPMSEGEDGEGRVLAVISPPTGSIPATIDRMPDPSLLQSAPFNLYPPPAQLLETEVSVYLAWARSVLGADFTRNEKSLVVRVGTEDTLLLFMEGNCLHQVDTLPSLTVEDPPDTICSRVLLYQDEYGMGDVENIFLVGEDNEGGLVDGFQPYFSKTDIQLLRDRIPYGGDDVRSGLYVAAIGAALRGYGASQQPFDIPAMNLSATAQRTPWSGVSLETSEGLLVLGIFLVTGAALAWYAVGNAKEIRQKRSRLQSLDQQAESLPGQQQLPSRVDSLHAIVDRYARSLQVRKELLRGSNKWSRGLADLAAGVEKVQGLSVRQWTPEGAVSVRVSGRAADRSRIIDFAQEMDGKIEHMTTTEIREWSLYAYEMTIPLDTTEPAAVQYWEEEQQSTVASGGTTRRSNTDGASANGAQAETQPAVVTTGGGDVPAGQMPPADQYPEATETVPLAAVIQEGTAPRSAPFGSMAPRGTSNHIELGVPQPTVQK